MFPILFLCLWWVAMLAIYLKKVAQFHIISPRTSINDFG